MVRHRGGGSGGRRHVRFCKDNHDEFHVDNHDDNGPIGGTSTCTMKTPATGTETAKEEVIECDCASPKEFKFRNKGMVF